MTPADRESLKKKIVDAIEKSKQEIASLEELTKPISPENSIGRVSRMDAINNKSVAEASLRSNRNKLSKLKVALTRVDHPDFGNCAFCNNPIQAARLMYMPESSRCVRCADR